MKLSLQTKFLFVSILLGFLTTAGVSTTYYVLTKQDKRRESRQRIRIAFDIVLNDFANRLNTYTQKIDEFLTTDTSLRMTTSSYQKKNSRISSISFIGNYLIPTANQIKGLGHDITMDRVALYAADKRLLAVDIFPK